MKLHAIQLPLEFDAARLRTDLETTIRYGTVRQFGNYHDGSWTGLSLRSEGGRALTTLTGLIPTGEPFADSPVLQSTPYFREVLGSIECPQRAVRLLHLPAGARIEPHVDAPLTFQHGILRLHIPIITHPDVEFVIDGIRCNWRAGELWWGNFSLLHHVYNNSTVNRVHLVMDVEITPALLSLFPPEFVEAQLGQGIAFHSDRVALAESELRQLECDVRVPPEVFPHSALRSGGVVGIRVLDGQLTVNSLATAPHDSVSLKLEAIGKKEFAIVGWSHAVTLQFSTSNEGVTSAKLVIRGLSKKYMKSESEDNPRLAHNEVALKVIGKPRALESRGPSEPTSAQSQAE